jgi:hypothetical protein
MRNFTTGFVCLLVLAGSASALRADSIFDFQGDTPVAYPGVPAPSVTPPGTQTTFTDTNNGIAATFTSAAAGGVNAPSGFIVQNFNTFQNFSGANSLYENDFIAPRFVNLVLSVGFSSLLSSSTLQFALNPEQGGDSLTLTAFLNGAPVGTPVTAINTGAVGTSYLYGSLSFAPGVDFNSISLSSDTIEFAIDDLSVTPSSTPSGVPEPASTTLVMVGLAGMLIYLRRFQQRKVAFAAAR